MSQLAFFNEEQSGIWRTARDRGFEAGYTGKPRNGCPYPLATDDGVAWVVEWHEGVSAFQRRCAVAAAHGWERPEETAEVRNNLKVQGRGGDPEPLQSRGMALKDALYRVRKWRQASGV